MFRTRKRTKGELASCLGQVTQLTLKWYNESRITQLLVCLHLFYQEQSSSQKGEQKHGWEKIKVWDGTEIWEEHLAAAFKSPGSDELHLSTICTRTQIFIATETAKTKATPRARNEQEIMRAISNIIWKIWQYDNTWKFMKHHGMSRNLQKDKHLNFINRFLAKFKHRWDPLLLTQEDERWFDYPLLSTSFSDGNFVPQTLPS
jgi:hypothetical protein